jgi:AraC-like DNA-binding protein
MQGSALENLVDGVAGAVQRDPGEGQLGRGDGADHGPVVVVVPGAEHVRGVDRHRKLPGQRPLVRLAQGLGVGRATGRGGPPTDEPQCDRPDRRVAVRIRELIHDAANDPTAAAGLTADDLAAAAGCSRFAAYRAFSRVFGLAPSDYQRQLRIRAARGLLSAGVSPALAAAEAGFADQAHLTRWFRRYYGVTPGIYQVAVRQ